MNDPMGTPMMDAPKKSNQGMIIGIVVAVLVLCCCCPVTLYVFYQYLGDPIIKALGVG